MVSQEMTLEEFTRRKRLVESLQRREAELAGAFEQQMRQLKEASGVDTLEEADALADRLKVQAAREKREADRTWQEWERKWRAKLEEL